MSVSTITITACAVSINVKAERSAACFSRDSFTRSGSERLDYDNLRKAILSFLAANYPHRINVSRHVEHISRYAMNQHLADELIIIKSILIQVGIRYTDITPDWSTPCIGGVAS